MRWVVALVLLVVLPACAVSRDHDRAAAAAFGPPHQVVALSPAARPICATTFGRGPRRVYLIGSIHGDEPEGRAALDDLAEQLAADTGGATVRLVHDMNPDGAAAHTRGNASGVDLNRNWPAANFRSGSRNGRAPLSEPEAAAIHADITRFDPHVIMVLHSARNGPFVNFDGPPAAEQLAEQFVAAARTVGDGRWRVVPDMGYSTPGSMGSYFGKDRGLPILTIEFRRGDSLERIPGPLLAGVGAVLADRSVALEPLGRLHGPRPRVAVAPADKEERSTSGTVAE